MPFKPNQDNPMWKENAGIQAIHIWVRKRMPTKDKCWNCKTAKAYDLANKGVYNRDLKNWKWLCRKCHMIEDGRLEKFFKIGHKRAPKRPCLNCGKLFFKPGEGTRVKCCSLSCGVKHSWKNTSKEKREERIRAWIGPNKSYTFKEK